MFEDFLIKHNVFFFVFLDQNNVTAFSNLSASVHHPFVSWVKMIKIQKSAFVKQ